MGFHQKAIVDIVAPWWGFWLLTTLFAFNRVKKNQTIFLDCVMHLEENSFFLAHYKVF